MNTKNYFFTLLLAAVICAPASLSAQVTIGSGADPSRWSLLDLDNQARIGLQERPKALHLPRMNSDDRDALAAPVSGDERREPQRGLMIFNVENHCLEFWSGTEWVSLCEGNEPPIRCGAYIAPGVWRRFMCHNLGVENKSLCPFTPDKGLHGAMFQFGVNTPVLTAAENISETGLIANWGTPPPAVHWTTSPCPPGWRIPNRDEWLGVLSNNPRRHEGTLQDDGSFTTGTFFGDYLFLPAAGGRASNITIDFGSSGELFSRGVQGLYWSSSRQTNISAVLVFLSPPSSAWGTISLNTDFGFSVRCMEDVEEL